LTQYRIFSKLRQSMTLPERLGWVRISSLWAYRALTWIVLAIGLAFAGMVLALRYWILPNIEGYREDIARIVGERAGQKITIGSIHANWDGLRPQLVLEHVTIFDTAGRPALKLARIDNTLSWGSVPALELRFHALDIYRPTLSIRRSERGIVSVGGIEMEGGEGGGGFAEWLLRQRDVEIHDATIVWNDEQRKAPQLELKNVFVRLLNSGGKHRFGVRATPPRDLAAPLDLRGVISGGSLKSLADWSGELFLQLDYVDIAAWRTWVPFPVQFPRGAGALRAWLTFSRDQLAEVVADVRLANVLTRLAQDLPQLDLTELDGRVGWKQSNGGFEVSTSRLRLTTVGGLKLPAADFLLRVSAGDKRRPARGELRTSALELEPLVTLADHLPLAEQTRKQLAEYSPKGRITDAVLQWTGEWHEPKEYSIRGRFRNAALRRVGRVPGFRGVTGSLEANERGGVLTLNSRKAAVEMPLVFRDTHEFDTLSAQVSWMRTGGETELRLNGISFSNAHLAGTVIGNYRTAGATAGSIDLTGNLTRADARYAGRYIPLAVAKSARDWLDAAFIAGESGNVTLRLKGNLDEFPFPGSRTGIFQVAARFTGGTLHYADGWPRISNIAGDLVFRGERMDVYARQGAISGARLARVHVEIPNLLGGGRILNVSGEADGPTAEFLKFIEASPVLGMIDHFTGGWQAQGAGKLALRLSIPLSDTAKSKVAGTYQFAGNSVTLSPLLPAVEQAAGRIDFTDTGVRVQGIRGVFLGGPVSIAAASTRDATVRVNVQGRINADIARRGGGPDWVQRLRGATDWRAQFVTRKRSADVVIESNLQGLAADLPAPLVKTAAESLPVRFERRLLSASQDRISFSAGDIVSMILLRRLDGENATIARGTVRFGGAAAEPGRNGLWVSGAVRALDADRWLAVLDQEGGGMRIEAGGADLKLGTVDMLGRRFGELAINASIQGGQWRVGLSGREFDGTVTWQPQGAGKLVARMNTLAIPAASPGAAEAASGDPKARKERKELPELDIVAEQFVNKGRHLGKLEVVAVPEDRSWRIDRLRLTNPESTFTVDGSWHFRRARPRTQVNVHLEASDIGKLLTRFGYPEGVKGGTAKLEGSLSWSGAPYEFDVPSLSGNLTLDAAKGQFVKLDPGIGKLLGVLSLQALPRRMSLDFKDVFSEGFAFNDIAGTVNFNGGTAATDNLRIRGPAAHIVMSGDVDLAQETQNLRVRITPQVIETASVAGALVGGPIAGVAAYVAQKLLRDPLGKFVTFEYSVTGSWSDPAVKRMPRPAGPLAPEAERSFE
jgi:uncharacterized protein (TIGR02099 family)